MARRFSLKPGDKVFRGATQYEVLAPASLSAVKVLDLATGQRLILSVEDLSARKAGDEAPPQLTLDGLTEDEQALAIEKFRVIKPAISENLSRREVEELAAKHQVHVSTVYRMIKKYRETMSPASLLPRVEFRGGKGGSRLPKEVESLILEHFEGIQKEKDLDITKLTVAALHRDIARKCRALDLDPPVWHTVRDRVDKFIRDQKLDGKRRRKGARPRTMAGGIFPDANHPLDVVQIDHTPLDIIVVDDENREPIGKPFLSLAIDVFSRMVMGFSLSLDPPSIFSVGQLIGHCVLPKTHFLEQVDVDAEWDIYGIMGMIHLDNAGEFRAEDFIPFQEEYLVDIRWRPVARPEYGGHIERLAGTLNTYVHEEPGSTMGNIFDREGYDSEGKACYTLDEIERWLTILITKIYHVENHSKLRNSRGEKISPLEKFKSGILGDDKTPGIGIPDVVEDQDRLKLFLLPSFKRVVQREGIELDCIHYFHDMLRNLYGKVGEDGKPFKYLIKRDPRRISPIYLFDPELKEYFPIPYRDLTRAPISLWELEAAKKSCRHKGVGRPNEQEIFNAFGELREIRETSLAKTKKARRERQAEKLRKKEASRLPRETAPSDDSPSAAPEVVDNVSALYEDDGLLDGVIVSNGREDERGDDG